MGRQAAKVPQGLLKFNGECQATAALQGRDLLWISFMKLISGQREAIPPRNGARASELEIPQGLAIAHIEDQLAALFGGRRVDVVAEQSVHRLYRIVRDARPLRTEVGVRVLGLSHEVNRFGEEQHR